MKLSSIIVAVMVSLLAACSTKTPQTKSYLLTPMPITAKVDYTASKPIIVLAPVRMNNLLDSKGIVYQTSSTEAVVAHQHLWVESISTQLFNRLLVGLRQGQTHYWVAQNSPQVNTPEAATLLVSFQQFNGNYQGYAEVAGEWSLLDGQGELLKSQPFSFKESLVTNGYNALVKALSTATDRLIAELSRELSGLVIDNAP